MNPLLKFAAPLFTLFLLTACNVTDNIRWSAAGHRGINTASAPSHAANIIRINFGRAEPYVDSAGNTWMGDTGIDDGDVVDRGAEQAIKNTRDADLYRTEHWGMTTFSYKLPNGHYLVKLYFCETSDHIDSPTQRVFSFTVEDKTFNDFDVLVKAGGFATPYIESVPVTITDGKLDMTFTASADNPEINAMEIIPQ